jgi:maltose O-acetyltransferase
VPGSRLRRWRDLAAPVAGVAASLAEDLRRLPFELVVNVVAASVLTPRIARIVLYRASGLDVAWGAVVHPGVRIRHRRGLHVGRGSTINQGCFFENKAPVTIGEFCGIGPRVLFVTTSHEWDDPSVRAGRATQAPITVADGTWVGAGAILLSGVDVGPGCVIGASAVVNRSTLPHGLYAGAPARRLRDLPT